MEILEKSEVVRYVCEDIFCLVDVELGVEILGVEFKLRMLKLWMWNWVRKLWM